MTQASPPAEVPVTADALPLLLRPLRHRNYRLFFMGQSISLLGTWMQTTAQAWLVYQLSHSVALLGITTFCAGISIFFLAPLGGMIADRVNRQRTLILTQGTAMSIAAILAMLTLSGLLQVWHIVLLAFVRGVVDGVDIPVRHALTLDMVNRTDLRSAIGLNSALFNIARAIGPLLATAVISWAGEGACFAINALSYSAVIIGLYRMDLPPRHIAEAERPLREIAAGYRHSLSDPVIRTSLLLVGAGSLFGAAYMSLMPAIARDLLHGSSDSFGLLMASAGVGAFAGVYLLSQLTEGHLIRIPTAAAIGFGGALITLSFSSSLWLSAILVFAAATSFMLLGGATNTNIQLTASPRFRGRAISHYNQCFQGMMPWGALLFGLLASRIGAAHSIAIGGAIVILCAIAARYRRTTDRQLAPF